MLLTWPPGEGVAGGVKLSDDSDAAQPRVLDHTAHVAGRVHVGHGIEGSLGHRRAQCLAQEQRQGSAHLSWALTW